MCTCCLQDEFSLLVEKWNELRVEAVDMALLKFLYPVMEKELRRKLLQEAQDHIIQVCCFMSSQELFSRLFETAMRHETAAMD